MSKLLPALFGGALALLASATTSLAVTLHLTDVDVTATGDPGLKIFTSSAIPNPAGYSLNFVNIGDTHTVDLFRIWTDETSINSDDTDPKVISAQLIFGGGSEPIVTGETVGGAVWITIFQFQYGQVTWGGPSSFVYDGTLFEVSLSDAFFNTSLYSLAPGPDNGATIEATITAKSRVNVPDAGSAALMLGLSLAGMAAVARRR